ncbi:hypothetical protein ONS95_004209 [Cadophora gregata]|uniref:uncharacterized protein n=1 Tax=Cadophora gregata TaxID=51156 RepID=UPI0026DC9072|nr:uncharacterized protein ONS95_004209 [Cadophora gregata]KAK0105419.1 hypothetical protein ONS96_004809 [Cadophora gregata f. sp. sojae]KAK0105682.1 hypothetical protein ONS95_004209 [Cadophora gregata]
MVHSISKSTVKKFLDGVGWSGIFKKVENTTRGTRLYPTNKAKDQAENMRFDAGSQVGDKFEIILQPNKNAANAAVKKAAQVDSHQILAKALVNKNSTKEEVQKAIVVDFAKRKQG